MRQALLQLRFADRDQQPLGVRGTFSNGGPPLCNSALGLMGQYLPDPIFRKLKLQTCRDQSQFAFLTIISRAGEIDIGRVEDTILLVLTNKDSFTAYELAAPPMRRKIAFQSRPDV